MMISQASALMDWSQLALKVLLTGISFIILVVISVWLIVRIQRALVVKNKREHVIKMTNQGNFSSIFSLSVVSVEKMLSFKLLLNDIPLMAVPQIENSRPISAGQNMAQAGSLAQQNTDKKPGANMSAAVKSGQAVAAKAGLVATLMGTLGALLPGSLGSNLRAQSEALRAAQSNTLAAAQAPVNAQRRVEALQQESGKLVGVKPTASTGGPPQSKQPVAQSASSAAYSQAVYFSSAAAKKAVPGVYMVQTQPLDPGDGLSLVLRIGSPRQHYPEGTFAYTLSSQQLAVAALAGEQPNKNQGIALEPVTRQGVVNFPHVDIWRYWLAPVTNLLVVATLLFTLIFIFRFIWF